MDGLSQKTVSYQQLVWGLFDFLLTWFLGIVLLVAAIPHLVNPYYFLGSVYAYKLVDPGVGQLVAILFPFVLLVLAILLLARILIDTTHLACAFLFLCFAVVQTIAFLRGLDISCGCFGPEHETTIGLKTLFFVYSLLLLSITRNIFCFFKIWKSRK
ncbi:MAG: hypothetical protein LBJ00_04610 [Planctomycetaceae bacterium]|jgi:hypothetical protein|nr:hypothetical protein [Planctomycetaceae bacterium]